MNFNRDVSETSRSPRQTKKQPKWIILSSISFICSLDEEVLVSSKRRDSVSFISVAVAFLHYHLF